MKAVLIEMRSERYASHARKGIDLESEALRLVDFGGLEIPGTAYRL